MIFPDLNLVTSNSIDATSVQQEFTKSFSARATVTHKKEFISGLKLCRDTIFEINDGVEHRSSAKGTIEIGGFDFSCYLVPTLPLSEISFTDFREQGSSSMIARDSGVHVCPEGSSVLKRIGMGVHGHFFFTRGVSGQDRGFQFTVKFK